MAESSSFVATRVARTPYGALREAGRPGYWADHATRLLLAASPFEPGETVAEVGCGTGLLSLAAAAAGASRVFATDVDAASVELLRVGARSNGLDAVVQVFEGHLLDPIPATVTLDLVITNLPQKPAPTAFSVRNFGGEDGADLLVACVEAAAERLRPGGRFVLFHNSIANPSRVREALGRAFDVEIAAERRRYFTVAEFERYATGMMTHLERLRREGRSEYFADRGRFYCFSRVYSGRRRA